MPRLDDQLSRSRRLAEMIREQQQTIADNNRYLKEQEQLIKDTINIGNNHILQLTRESDELIASITQLKAESISIRMQIDNRKFELLSLDIPNPY